MRRLLALFAALCCAIAVPAEERHTADTLDQVKTSVAAGSAVLIDVREQEDWDSGHLQAARLVPLSVLTRDGAAIPACRDPGQHPQGQAGLPALQSRRTLPEGRGRAQGQGL
jgi:hypothetical protein